MSWLFIAILIILIAVFFIYMSNGKVEQYQSNNIKIYLFYATWCGHCHKYLESNIFMTTFDEIKKTNANVTFEMIDFDKNKELANKYNVSSFPSIISASSDGTFIKEFSGNRNNKEELKEFVKESM